MDETGYIYIIKLPPFYKVGKTFDLKARMRLYAKAEGREPRLVYSRHVKDNWRVENRLIAFCQGYPSRGEEWFKLPRRKVHRLIKYLETIPEIPGKCDRQAYIREQKRMWEERETRLDIPRHRSALQRLNGWRLKEPNGQSNGITTVNTGEG